MPAKAEQPQQDRVARLEAELAHERRVSSVLREVGLAIGAVVDLDQILGLILSKITEVVEAERATLYLVDEANEQLTSRVTVGDSTHTIRLPIGKGIAGTVARTGKPIRVRDAYDDKRFFRGWDDTTGYRTRSILAVPMKNHMGWVMGVVQALNKRGGGEFSAEDESLLMALATHAAVTVDNSRLYLSAIQKNLELSETKVQLERKVRELDLLFKLESAMGRTSTVEGLLRAALGEAVATCEARAGAVLLPEETTEPGAKPRRGDHGAQALPFSGLAAIYFYDGGERRKIRTVLARPTEGFIGSVYTSGKASVSQHLPHDSEGARKLDAALGFETTSAVGAPLEGQDGPIGALALYNKEGGRPFQEEDLYLLRLIAANVSTAVQLHRSRVAQERAERLTSIGRLLSGVIHDLKSPMTVISGYVQMMVSADAREQRASYAEHIHKQFDLIQQMQREVLEFARGERTLWVRRVYLEPFLEGLREPLSRELAGSSIELEAEAEDRGVARFDEAKITRAINNLVRNAIDAMREQRAGKLGLRVRREGGAVVFSVSDTGPGIPKEIQKKLFESFATSGKKHGTGLGLAIVKRIVDEHGGSVEVQSSARGTTFRLLLPQPP